MRDTSVGFTASYEYNASTVFLTLGILVYQTYSEQVFTLRNIIEQSLEHQQDLIINFIDYKKAFDSVHRPSLWKILKYYGIPDRSLTSSRHCTSTPAAVSRPQVGTQSSLRSSQGFDNDKAVSFHHSSSS